MTGSVRVGSYALEVGTQSGSVALFEHGAESEHARGLGKALAAEPTESPTQVEALEEFTESANAVADRIDHAEKLFEAAAAGRLLDRDFVTGEIDSLLELLQRLDRADRYDEELRLARALHGLLVLAFRWLELVRSLRLVLDAARRARDVAGQAWALHELGALHLCAGRAAQAQEYLEAALALEGRVGNALDRCATRHNLDSARRDLALRRLWRRLTRTAAVVGILALVGGGVAAFALIDDPPPPPGGKLTLAVDLRGGGTGSVTRGTTIACPDDCDETVEPGTSVMLTARASGRSTFVGWEDVDCAEGVQDTATCTVTVGEDVTVGVVFDAPVVRTLTVDLRGDGNGSVRRGDTIACPDDCDEVVDAGTSVTLTATAEEGSTFAGWEDVDCSEGAQDRTTCTVKVDEDTTVGAVFEPLELVSLSVSGAGGSGRVTSDQGGIDCSSPGICTGTVVAGTEVTFTAIPAGISYFVRWDGVTCADEDDNEVADPPSCTVTATDDVEVTAVFNEVE